jgi:hypothetical protein
MRYNKRREVKISNSIDPEIRTQKPVKHEKKEENLDAKHAI